MATDPALQPIGSLLDPRNRLDKLTLGAEGTKLPKGVAQNIIGVPTISLTSSEVSQLDITFNDPGFEQLDKGTFAPGTDLAYIDFIFTVVSLEANGDGGAETLAVVAQSAPAVVFRNAVGLKVEHNVSPTDFVGHLASEAGLSFVGQPSSSRKHVARREPKGQPAESSWDCAQRLAADIGYVCFEARGRLFFAKPSWLVEQARLWTVKWPAPDVSVDVQRLIHGKLPALNIPRCRLSTVEDPKVQVDVEVPIDLAFLVMPGDALALDGIPTFDDTYLISSVTFNLDASQAVNFTGVTPQDPPVMGKGGHPNGPTADGGLKPVGDALKAKGFLITENPAFGGVSGTCHNDPHAVGSYHCKIDPDNPGVGLAIDVNWPDPASEDDKLREAYSWCKNHVRGIAELFYDGLGIPHPISGHDTHLHLAIHPGGGLITETSSGGGAATTGGGWTNELVERLKAGYRRANRPDMVEICDSTDMKTWLGAESAGTYDPTIVSPANNNGKVNGGLFQFWAGHPWAVQYFTKGVYTPGSSGNKFTAGIEQQAVFSVTNFNLTPSDVATYAREIRDGTYHGWG